MLLKSWATPPAIVAQGFHLLGLAELPFQSPFPADIPAWMAT
jgi:hypothetical protein